MRISRATICNFRSIARAEFGVAPYSVLIGPNNGGKSNLLRAIEWALTPSREITKADRPSWQFISREPMEVRLEFEQLTPNEAKKFAGHLRADGTMVMLRFSGRIAAPPDDAGYCSLHDDGQERRFEPSMLKPGILPEIHFVPALFDLANELKNGGASSFGSIVRHLMSRVPHTLEFAFPSGALPPNLFDPWRFRELGEKLTEDLQNFGGTVGVTGPKPTPEAYAASVTLTIDDGARTAPKQKGHGIQRALLFALLRQWIRLKAEVSAFLPSEGSAESVILALEEPELNIHPHGIRTIVADLRRMTDTANQQVLVCTHSPHFVDLADPEAITIVYKTRTEDGTTVRQYVAPTDQPTEREARRKSFNAARYFNADRSELFFAEKIILVEGATEKKLLPYLASLLNCHRPGVSIIDCDGKFNLRPIMEILNALGLPYAVMHDLDPLPENPNPGHQRVFNESARIKNVAGANPVYVCDPWFEEFAGVKITPNKPFGAFEHFEGTTAVKIPDGLATRVRALYA